MSNEPTIRVSKDAARSLAANAQLGVVLVCSPVPSERWQAHVVMPDLVIERISGRDGHDGQMSRRHATLMHEGDHLTLMDGAAQDGQWKPSANGTIGPQGQQVGQTPIPLRIGDAFQTGQSLWVVVQDPMTVAEDQDSLLKGASVALQELRDEILMLVAMVAKRLRKGDRVYQSLLVTGPRGAGKQVVSREAHRMLAEMTKNPKAPFRQVSAPGLEDGTGAADLFGVVDGYATGSSARAGYFEQAHGGVLLLDEVGDTPASAQPKLLNALQEREVTRLGGKKTIAFDCLVIGATNRELDPPDDDEASARAAESKDAGGNLRSDLVDRLARFRVHIPPLSERPEDIPFILDDLLERHGVAEPPPADLVHELMRRPWPGNVRELDITLERMVALSDYRDEALSLDLLARATRPPTGSSRTAPTTDPGEQGAAEQIAQRRGRPSREELVRVLEECGWSRTEAAKAFGRTTRQLRRWITHYELTLPDASN